MIFNNNLNDYFAIILAIVATLNGIAIPLSYNIISVNLKPYLDKNISKIFLEEEDFKSNIIVSVWALPFFCFPLIFDIRTILALPDGNSLSIAFVNVIFNPKFYFYCRIFDFIYFLLKNDL